MRNLQTRDVFAFCRLVNEIGIKDELKEVCRKAENITDAFEGGYELLFGIFDKATGTKGEKALIKFFADIFEEDEQAVAESDPVDFLDKVMQVAEPAKWLAFFNRAAALGQ